jgi:hypothetical protein
MANLISSGEQSGSWKTQSYLIGAAAGLLFGLVSAYMYTRAAEEDVSRAGLPHRATPGEMLGLGLAALAMVRQVAEMGKGPEDNKSKKRR